MKKLLFFFLCFFSIGILHSQCDVVIQPGSLQMIDIDPGIKFQFTLQNNGSVPFQNGTFHMSFGWMDNPINPDPVWNINLSFPLQPGETTIINTPVFDVPLPSNATEWPYWDDITGPNGWPNSNYGTLRVYLNSCFWISANVNNFLPQSDDCPNINDDQFCDCNIEMYDFRLEPEPEVDIIIHSDYNCYPSAYPPGFLEFGQNNPAIFYLTIGVKSFIEDNCGSTINNGYSFLQFHLFPTITYELGEVLTLPLSSSINFNNHLCLPQSISFGNFENCYEVILWQINNGVNTLSESGNDLTPNDNIITVDNGCGVVNSVSDLSIESFDYTVIGCDVGSPYASTQITVTNEGNTVINSFCINFDILNDGILGIQNCFDNLNLLPGESYIVNIDGEVMANGVTSIFITTPNETTTSNNFIVGIIDLPCYGCLNTGAINYDPFATVDDGSCILPIFGCTDPEANNFNPNANTDDGSCTYDPILIYGCTDPEANNYNADANTDDGSCTYDPILIFGCTDPEANNYNPDANTDDGSCTYDPILIYGCTDPMANNYNPDANMDDDSCTYDILGCTDLEANNYNPNANIDDGSCTYDPEIIFGCTDPTAINFDPTANTNDGTCIYEIDICEEPDLHTFIPNAISPNNDGLNDVWKVVTQSDCWKQWKVQIYNRWGSLIWESEDPDAVWTASNDGSKYYVSDGIYVYTITGVAWNNKPIQKSGYISVFR